MISHFQRPLLVHPAMIFSGVCTMLYQSSGFSFVGSSINILCALSFILAYFTASKHLHVVEGSLFISLGFVLPFFLRSVISFGTALQWDVVQGISISLLSMFAISFVFSYVGFYTRKCIATLKSSTPPEKRPSV